MTDYSEGHYLVLSDTGKQIGRIDLSAYVCRDDQRLYRIDGDEVYTPGLDAKHLGWIEDGVATDSNGKVLFVIVSA